MTMRTIFLTAGVALGLSGAAAAQTAPSEPATAPIPQNGTAVEVEGGADVGTTLGAGALPGVGVGTATTTETDAPAGPGGLQNGVGAQGVMAPSMTGSAESTDGSVPSSGGTGLGVPIDSPATSN